MAAPVDLVYWPTMQMVLWGFISRSSSGQSSLIAQAGGIFLSAILLWDILFRGQLGTSLCFIEEMYARHSATCSSARCAPPSSWPPCSRSAPCGS